MPEHNYLPREAREAYKAALGREFRSFPGEKPAPEASHRLEVVVLGAGCFGCQNLYRQVIDLLAKKSVQADVQYLTDPVRLKDYPVQRLPALLVNGRVVLAGRLPDPAELEGLLLMKEGGRTQKSAAPEGPCPCT